MHTSQHQTPWAIRFMAMQGLTTQVGWETKGSRITKQEAITRKGRECKQTNKQTIDKKDEKDEKDESSNIWFFKKNTKNNNNKLNFIIYRMVESTFSKVSGQLPLKRMLLPSKPIYHMLLDVSHTSNF